MTELTTAERNKIISKARSTAEKRVLKTHETEFKAAYREELAKTGLDITPRRTGEEKAEAELAALLRAHPSLAQRLMDEVAAKAAVPADSNTAV